MEKKRKLRGKWLVVLGALLMAAGLCMLLLQPSVLQYCIVAPVEEAAPQAGTAQGTEGQAGALEELAETWQARVEEDLSEVLSAASIAARDYGFALSGEGGTATATLTAVGEGWFDVYPRYLVSGRLMTAQELLDGDRLVVLDEPLAFKLFPTTDAVGRELQIGAGRYEVIGVVRYQRAVGEYGQYQAYIPYASAAQERLPMETVEACGVGLPHSGASRTFEDAAGNWQAGGTFIDTDKEAMRGSIIARVLAVALGMYLILYLLRRLNGCTGGFAKGIRLRLKTEYFRSMLPSILPRAGLLALGYAALLAAAYGILTLAIEPMYVFTEWIPDVLVELSSITERFWQLTSAAAKPVFIRTKEYAEIRFWAGLLRWGAVATLTGALVMALSARDRKGKSKE